MMTLEKLHKLEKMMTLEEFHAYEKYRICGAIAYYFKKKINREIYEDEDDTMRMKIKSREFYYSDVIFTAPSGGRKIRIYVNFQLKVMYKDYGILGRVTLAEIEKAKWGNVRMISYSFEDEMDDAYVFDLDDWMLFEKTLLYYLDGIYR